ncbi:MAG: DUF4245 family protein [Nakamurella sp.]
MATRRPNTLRDITISMVLLAVVALVLVGMYGGVSFSPGGPTDGQTQTADITGGMQRAEPLVGFTVVVPVGVPGEWTSSSFAFTEQPGTSEAPPAVRGGWLTEQGRFITLIESSGAIADVQRAELGSVNPETGTEQAGGATWSVTSGRRNEVAWIRTAGDVVYLITGSASPDDFHQLAEAVAAAG